jgi:hypothetical protein
MSDRPGQAPEGGVSPQPGSQPREISAGTPEVPALTAGPARPALAADEPGGDKDKRRGWRAGEGSGAGDRDGTGHPDMAQSTEEVLERQSYEDASKARSFRDDIRDAGTNAEHETQGNEATFNFGDNTSVGDMAARDMYSYHYHHNYTFYGEDNESRQGPIGATWLARAARVYVATESDARLQAQCRSDHVVFLQGRRESGRRSSAIHALDELTGQSRQDRLVSILQTTSGLAGVAKRLTEGHGYLLDASAEDGLDTITEDQRVEVLGALEAGRGGYLIVLVGAGATTSLPVPVVNHEPPEPSPVVLSHIAAGLAGDADVTDGHRDAAVELLDEALEVSAVARNWYDELTSGDALQTRPAPAEAAHLAMAIVEWAGLREKDRSIQPRIQYYRNLRLERQARALLGRGDLSDSPLRQAYVIATAVLDGLTVSDVADEARQLAALLEEAEGGSRKRRIFAETSSYWFSHADMPGSVTEDGRSGTSGGAAVVRMPSRRLSRIIVEVAWHEYHAARVPLRSWLVRLCGEHRDATVRIRGAQALAFIAAHDYPHVKLHVLNEWASSSRPIEHQAAAWLLEAVTVTNAADSWVARQVQALLRRWSLSPEWQRRAIAVRAYGTKAGLTVPDFAMAGIRVSAADPDFTTLPELALEDLYGIGLREPVLRELRFWTNAFPAMRERVGQALVRVASTRRADAGKSGYDLLWRLAHEPETAGVEMDDLARLWRMACQQERSRNAAWKMLGRWALSCRGDLAQRDAFVKLADTLDAQIDQAGLRKRFRIYRRRWDEYLTQEDER